MTGPPLVTKDDKHILIELNTHQMLRAETRKPYDAECEQRRHEGTTADNAELEY